LGLSSHVVRNAFKSSTQLKISNLRSPLNFFSFSWWIFSQKLKIFIINSDKLEVKIVFAFDILWFSGFLKRSALSNHGQVVVHLLKSLVFLCFKKIIITLCKKGR